MKYLVILFLLSGCSVYGFKKYSIQAEKICAKNNDYVSYHTSGNVLIVNCGDGAEFTVKTAE